MDQAEMRTLVRRDLHDEDAGSYRWSDEDLDRHIDRAVRELSQAIPQEKTATLATTAGSREIDISSLADRVLVRAAEYPVDRFPVSYQRFAIWANTLTLLGDTLPDGSDCRIYYGSLHTLDASTSTIPAGLEDLVALGAAGYALVQRAAFAVNRVNLGGTDTPRHFRDEGQSRISQFRKELKRFGRGGRVRGARLYTPARGIRGPSTDPGP